MTANEALLVIIPGWSEEEASKLLREIEPPSTPVDGASMLSALELQALPKSQRSAAIRAQLALLTPAELEEDLGA